MTQSNFIKYVFIPSMERVKSLYETKGVEYQEADNMFSNFEENAKRLNISPYQVWAIYFNKHVSSVLSAIKEDPNNPKGLSEPLQERLLDIISYSILALGMLSKTSFDNQTHT